MNGSSFGLRSGSYGSLQPHGNGSPFSPASGGPGPSPLPIQAAAAAAVGSGGRKSSKPWLAGSRERRAPWIWKLASRRKVGMLLILVASAAVLLSFIPAFTRGDRM